MRLSDETKQGIAASLLAGVSQHQTAKTYKVSSGTVHTVARSLGLTDPEHSSMKKANAARVKYSADKRRELSDILFARVQVLASAEPTGQELKDVVMSYAILTDKRRLEDGQATQYVQPSDPHAAISQGRERLKLLQTG